MHHPQITLQKTLCLFFVIVAHATFPFTEHSGFWQLYADTQATGAEFVATIFSYTLVPSFIFASGFLLEKSFQTTPCIGDIAGKRIKRLIVPWFLVMLFWLVPLYSLFDIPAYNRPQGSSFWATLLAGLQGRFTDHLWFLLALFWASLFWIAARPMLDRLRIPDLSAGALKTGPAFWMEKVRARLRRYTPDWIQPEWFALHGEKPAFTVRDFAGLGLALVVAVTVHVGAKDMTWFCFREAAGPSIFLYCGMLACRHAEWLDTFLWENRAKTLPALALLFLVLLPVGKEHFLLAWFLRVLGALLTYHTCLLFARIGFPAKKGNGAYAYFEKNAFRFYLFHAPTVLLVFLGLNALDILSPWFCIIATTVLTLLITAGVVYGSHVLERTQLPKIVNGMRPEN
ncbi:MAG: acyltransferase [Deltaproteobacteria bacterium]|nr:acyltransferase [Deltaproteobacteria bacterium]